MRSKDSNSDLNNWFKCKDKLYCLNSPLIMGVLNATSDSFYEESRKFKLEEAISHVHKMIIAGADIIDIGGISTRSNADLLSSEEELKRILPVIREIKNHFPDTLLSIDTFRADVAEIAVENGVHIINDVYGGRYDENMFDTVAKLDVPYILMHSRGDSSNMQQLCDYDDVVMDVVFELSQSVEKLRSKGVKDIIIDPGFGFAKNVEQNYKLLKDLDFLSILDCPLLIGVSRKSMIYKLLNSTPSDSLIGTVVLNTFGVLNNASIVRVHDVKEANEMNSLMKVLKN